MLAHDEAPLYDDDSVPAILARLKGLRSRRDAQENDFMTQALLPPPSAGDGHPAAAAAAAVPPHAVGELYDEAEFRAKDPHGLEAVRKTLRHVERKLQKAEYLPPPGAPLAEVLKQHASLGGRGLGAAEPPDALAHAAARHAARTQALSVSRILGGLAAQPAPSLRGCLCPVDLEVPLRGPGSLAEQLQRGEAVAPEARPARQGVVVPAGWGGGGGGVGVAGGREGVVVVSGGGGLAALLRRQAEQQTGVLAEVGRALQMQMEVQQQHQHQQPAAAAPPPPPPVVNVHPPAVPAPAAPKIDVTVDTSATAAILASQQSILEAIGGCLQQLADTRQPPPPPPHAAPAPAAPHDPTPAKPAADGTPEPQQQQEQQDQVRNRLSTLLHSRVVREVRLRCFNALSAHRLLRRRLRRGERLRRVAAGLLVANATRRASCCFQRWTSYVLRRRRSAAGAKVQRQLLSVLLGASQRSLARRCFARLRLYKRANAIRLPPAAGHAGAAATGVNLLASLRHVPISVPARFCVVSNLPQHGTPAITATGDNPYSAQQHHQQQYQQQQHLSSHGAFPGGVLEVSSPQYSSTADRLFEEQARSVPSAQTGFRPFGPKGSAAVSGDRWGGVDTAAAAATATATSPSSPAAAAEDVIASSIRQREALQQQQRDMRRNEDALGERRRQFDAERITSHAVEAVRQAVLAGVIRQHVMGLPAGGQDGGGAMRRPKPTLANRPILEWLEEKVVIPSLSTLPETAEAGAIPTPLAGMRGHGGGGGGGGGGGVSSAIPPERPEANPSARTTSPSTPTAPATAGDAAGVENGERVENPLGHQGGVSSGDTPQGAGDVPPPPPPPPPGGGVAEAAGVAHHQAGEGDQAHREDRSHPHPSPEVRMMLQRQGGGGAAATAAAAARRAAVAAQMRGIARDLLLQKAVQLLRPQRAAGAAAAAVVAATCISVVVVLPSLSAGRGGGGPHGGGGGGVVGLGEADVQRIVGEEVERRLRAARVAEGERVLVERGEGLGRCAIAAERLDLDEFVNRVWLFREEKVRRFRVLSGKIEEFEFACRRKIVATYGVWLDDAWHHQLHTLALLHTTSTPAPLRLAGDGGRGGGAGAVDSPLLSIHRAPSSSATALLPLPSSLRRVESHVSAAWVSAASPPGTPHSTAFSDTEEKLKAAAVSDFSSAAIWGVERIQQQHHPHATPATGHLAVPGWRGGASPMPATPLGDTSLHRVPSGVEQKASPPSHLPQSNIPEDMPVSRHARGGGFPGFPGVRTGGDTDEAVLRGLTRSDVMRRGGASGNSMIRTEEIPVGRQAVYEEMRAEDVPISRGGGGGGGVPPPHRPTPPPYSYLGKGAGASLAPPAGGVQRHAVASLISEWFRGVQQEGLPPPPRRPEGLTDPRSDMRRRGMRRGGESTSGGSSLSPAETTSYGDDSGEGGGGGGVGGSVSRRRPDLGPSIPRAVAAAAIRSVLRGGEEEGEGSSAEATSATSCSTSVTVSARAWWGGGSAEGTSYSGGSVQGLAWRGGGAVGSLRSRSTADTTGTLQPHSSAVPPAARHVRLGGGGGGGGGVVPDVPVYRSGEVFTPSDAVLVRSPGTTVTLAAPGSDRTSYSS